MALGGGTWQQQNKTLPGAYINFVSADSSVEVYSERGVAAMPLELDWGPDGKVFKVDNKQFHEECEQLFGYKKEHESMQGLSDLFKHLKRGYFYRVNSGEPASCIYGNARYSGKRGNDLRIVIRENVDDAQYFDVEAWLDNTQIDKQKVQSAEQLVDNAYMEYKKDAELAVTAGTPFKGGSNKGSVTLADYQECLARLEAYTFNTLGCPVADEDVASLCIAYTKRMRDQVGSKFQTVVFGNATADYEGVISVETEAEGDNPAALVYWVTGAEAGCEIDQTITNKLYDGGFDVRADYTQVQLEDAIKKGKFKLHNVGGDVRVLMDINTLITYTEDKSKEFGSNQTMRVVDDIAVYIANLFNRNYLGKVLNDADGRMGLWAEIVKRYRELAEMAVITDFDAEDVQVRAGREKDSVVVESAVQVTGAMNKLYMTVVVS